MAMDAAANSFEIPDDLSEKFKVNIQALRDLITTSLALIQVEADTDGRRLKSVLAVTKGGDRLDQFILFTSWLKKSKVFKQLLADYVPQATLERSVGPRLELIRNKIGTLLAKQEGVENAGDFSCRAASACLKLFFQQREELEKKT